MFSVSDGRQMTGCIISKSRRRHIDAFGDRGFAATRIVGNAHGLPACIGDAGGIALFVVRRARDRTAGVRAFHQTIQRIVFSIEADAVRIAHGQHIAARVIGTNGFVTVSINHRPHAARDIFALAHGFSQRISHRDLIQTLGQGLIRGSGDATIGIDRTAQAAQTVGDFQRRLSGRIGGEHRRA